MSRETPIRIITQGAVELASDHGYMVAGGDDAVCFYIDPRGRACVNASTSSNDDCPVVFLCADNDDDESELTEIEFPEFKGWRFHAGGRGKTVAIALVRRGSDE